MKPCFHFKAIITNKRGRILSIGENSYAKTHPYMAEMATAHGDPKQIFLHAEIAAILRCKDLTKASHIEIFRIKAKGVIERVKPCIICASAIQAAGLEVKL